MTQIFSHGIFFIHRTTRNLFGGFLLRRLLTDFRRCDLSGRCRYPLRLEKVPQISQIYTDIYWDVFLSHADFADDADFFSWDFFYSSDDTEFIRRFLAAAITHGFSRMRPVRSLQIPPEVGKSPTDFTDIHRYLLGRFFKSRRFRRWRRFFLMGFFLFIGRHGIYSEVSCCGDYSRIFADATCPVVADTPWGWKMSHRFHRFTQIFSSEFFVPQISQIYTDIYWDVFLSHADFADDADFFSWDFFYSSDDTEFIRRFLAAAITHGFSRMRPVRSLQIPPETGQRDSPEIP